MLFTKSMREKKPRGLVIALLFTLMPWAVWGESDSPHPVTEKEIPEERAPLNLDKLKLEELLEYRKSYLEKINILRAEIDKINDESGRLVAALKDYDKQRIRIAEILPGLIKHYSISTPLSTTLMTYAETIRGIHEDYKDHLDGLDTYKSYDFRIGVAYTSMMAQLAEYKNIYQRMQEDMKDEKTLLGGYQAALKKYYGRVEEIVRSKKMTEFYSLKQIEKELGRIDEEISERGDP